MRLPSEAEWEYAAKGPVHRRYPWGDLPEPTCTNLTAQLNEPDTQAGYGCWSGGTAPVGSKPTGSSWSGALDMAGNVFEWVEDCWHTSYAGEPPLDGSAWVADCVGSNRVLRVYGFNAPEDGMRAASRYWNPPDRRFAMFGARCARSLP